MGLVLFVGKERPPTPSGMEGLLGATFGPLGPAQTLPGTRQVAPGPLAPTSNPLLFRFLTAT